MKIIIEEKGTQTVIYEDVDYPVKKRLKRFTFEVEALTVEE